MTMSDIAANGAAGRVFFYVQHLLGIGHLARASRIAGALKDAGFEVTLVTGGSAVEGFPGEGISHVALPAIVASNSGFSGLADLEGNPVDERFQRDRAERLIEAYQPGAARRRHHRGLSVRAQTGALRTASPD